MANMYRSNLSGGGTAPTGDATAADVLTGKTFSNAQGVGIAGAMPNRGAVTASISGGQSYNIPEGYHNGNGVITATPSSFSYMKFTPGTTTPPNANKAYIILGLNSASPTLSKNGNSISPVDSYNIGTAVATYLSIFEVDNVSSADTFSGTGAGYILYA